MLNLNTKKYGMWWYEWGHGKPKWKTLMIYNDAIHVQVEKGGKDNNAKGIGTLEANDCMCAVHDVWWHAKFALTMYKWPQSGQGTRICYWWDGWVPSVSIDDWRVAHGWWGRKGVECVDGLGVTKKIDKAK